MNFRNRIPLTALALGAALLLDSALALAQAGQQTGGRGQVQQQGRGAGGGGGRGGGGGAGRGGEPLPADVKTLRGPRPVAGDFSFDIKMGLPADAKLTAAIAEVSAARLRRIDSTLVSFGSRTTQSDTLSTTRGIGAARRWIHAELSSYSRDCNGCLQVEFQQQSNLAQRLGPNPVNIVNVLGILPGRDTSKIMVLGGHYDSCHCSGGTDPLLDEAPGANDDGSGTSAIIELARVMSRNYPQGLEATVIFALYAGEENGLVGSTNLARKLTAEGKTIIAAVTNDIVGNIQSDDGRKDSTTVRVFSPGGDWGSNSDNGSSRELGRYVWALGEVYLPGFDVFPVFRLDRVGRGGDHRPFHELGWPAVRFSERMENFGRQHNPTDQLDGVNFNYLANVTKLDVALAGSLSQAPATPSRLRTARERSVGNTIYRLTWNSVPGASAYEVLVRKTISPTWEVVLDAGADTLVLLDYQLDDVTIGVRSVGANGHRSLPRVYPTAPEAPIPPDLIRAPGTGPGGTDDATASARPVRPAPWTQLLERRNVQTTGSVPSTGSMHSLSSVLSAGSR